MVVTTVCVLTRLPGVTWISPTMPSTGVVMVRWSSVSLASETTSLACADASCAVASCVCRTRSWVLDEGLGAGQRRIGVLRRRAAPCRRRSAACRCRASRAWCPPSTLSPGLTSTVISVPSDAEGHGDRMDGAAFADRGQLVVDGRRRSTGRRHNDGDARCHRSPPARRRSGHRLGPGPGAVRRPGRCVAGCALALRLGGGLRPRCGAWRTEAAELSSGRRTPALASMALAVGLNSAPMPSAISQHNQRQEQLQPERRTTTPRRARHRAQRGYGRRPRHVDLFLFQRRIAAPRPRENLCGAADWTNERTVRCGAIARL